MGGKVWPQWSLETVQLETYESKERVFIIIREIWYKKNIIIIIVREIHQ